MKGKGCGAILWGRQGSTTLAFIAALPHEITPEAFAPLREPSRSSFAVGRSVGALPR